MKITVYCKNLDRKIDVEAGISLAQIAGIVGSELGFDPICCRVNNKTEALDFVLYQPKIIEFQSKTIGSGPRVYTRSLCMMLYRAISAELPGTQLTIEHSISHGYYCRLEGYDSVPKDITDRLAAYMRGLVERNLPFERHQDLTADVCAIFEQQGLMSKARLLRTIRELYTTYYTLDGVPDSYYGALAPSTAHIDVFDLQPYKKGFLLLPFDACDPSQPAKPIAQEKMYKAFTDYVQFNHIVGVSDVGELNTYVQHHRAADLINVSEALHEKALARISDDIAARYHEGGARIVLISGPSSSGKTTTTKRLAIHLMTNLLKPQMISLDDYFVDRDHTPRDESGEFDYESLYALDLAQFNADLTAILAGEEVELPTYNFERGQREYRGKRIRLGEGSILLIEGIHGLNPELTSHIPDKMKYRVYVSALTTLSIDDHNWVPTTDNRLLRRIIRDHKYRGTRPTRPYVAGRACAVARKNGYSPIRKMPMQCSTRRLLFELGVMKNEAETVLHSVPFDVPEYAEAYRLRKFLSYFLPINTALIPSTSLLREFLGGSSFKY